MVGVNFTDDLVNEIGRQWLASMYKNSNKITLNPAEDAELRHAIIKIARYVSSDYEFNDWVEDITK